MSNITEEKALNLLKSNKEKGLLKIDNPEEMMEKLTKRYGDKAPDLVYSAITAPTTLMEGIDQKATSSAKTLDYITSDEISKENIEKLGAKQEKIELKELNSVAITPTVKLEGKIENIEIQTPEPEKKKGSLLKRLFKKKEKNTEEKATIIQGKVEELPKEAITNSAPVYTNEQGPILQGKVEELPKEAITNSTPVVAKEQVHKEIKEQTGEYPPKAPTPELENMQKTNDQQLRARVDETKDNQTRTTAKGVKYAVTENGVEVNYNLSQVSGMEVDRLMPQAYKVEKDGIVSIGPAKGQFHSAAQLQAQESMKLTLQNHEVYNDIKQRQTNGEQLSAAETKFMTNHEKDLKSWSIEMIDGKGLVQVNPPSVGGATITVKNADILEKRIKNDIKSKSDSNMMKFKMAQARRAAGL